MMTTEWVVTAQHYNYYRGLLIPYCRRACHLFLNSTLHRTLQARGLNQTPTWELTAVHVDGTCL